MTATHGPSVGASGVSSTPSVASGSGGIDSGRTRDDSAGEAADSGLSSGGRSFRSTVRDAGLGTVVIGRRVGGHMGRRRTATRLPERFGPGDPRSWGRAIDVRRFLPAVRCPMPHRTTRCCQQPAGGDTLSFSSSSSGHRRRSASTWRVVAGFPGSTCGNLRMTSLGEASTAGRRRSDDVSESPTFRLGAMRTVAPRPEDNCDCPAASAAALVDRGKRWRCKQVRGRNHQALGGCR